MPPFASVAELDARVSILRDTQNALKTLLFTLTSATSRDVEQLQDVESRLQAVRKQIKALNVAKSRGRRYREYKNKQGQRPKDTHTDCLPDRVARIRADEESWFAFFAEN